MAEQRGELERSLSYWMRAKKIDPEDPEILLGFGRVCLRMDLLDDAEPALVKAAALKPDDRTYQYTLAAAKVGKKQFEAAQHLVEPLVEKQPADPQLQYALGSILYLEGHLTEAAAHLRESLRSAARAAGLAVLPRPRRPGPGERDRGDRHSGEAAATLSRSRRVERSAGRIADDAQRYAKPSGNCGTPSGSIRSWSRRTISSGLLLARTGRKEEADRQLALAKSLREEDEATSRLQLRLLDPGQ